MISERQARIYCYEDLSLIENYELAIADKTQTWDCHHRVEDIMNCGAKELIAQGCYENRPAHDLIFLPHGKHSSLHKAGENHPMYGKHHSAESRAKMSAAQIGKKCSEETRAKLSAARIGKNNPFFGRHHSEEIRKKIGASNKGQKRSEDTREKISAALNKPETRAKMSTRARATSTGRHWFNNGIENKFCKECPGPEWNRGMLIHAQ